MAFEHYISSGGRRLRCGFTTGTCAALAAAGAVRLLLTGNAPEQLTLKTPSGLSVSVIPDSCGIRDGCAYCGVRKDAGDDIDATDGLLICAEACLTGTHDIQIDGGEGVGRVTKPGLDQPVGAAAINSVPRRMISEEVESACRSAGYSGGVKITISVPDGAAAAQKTFNPELGIQGGISILGTSGIVEPMSMDALRDAILLEIRQQAAMGARRLILTPGSYGMEFLTSCGLSGGGAPAVKCSNFIGDAVDEAKACGYAQVLLVGHIGKLIKLAGGIFNTHSRYADCRAELFCAHSAVCGADQDTCRELMAAATTDACIEILDRVHLRQQVMESLLDAIGRQLRRRAGGEMQADAVLFSNVYGFLGRTDALEEGERQ